jgi:hypothetical protein
MSEVIKDPAIRAAKARAILDDPLYREIMASLRQRQIDVFLAGAGPDEVKEAQAIVAALKMIDNAFRSTLTDERMIDRRKRKGQHRNVD